MYNKFRQSDKLLRLWLCNFPLLNALHFPPTRNLNEGVQVLKREAIFAVSILTASLNTWSGPAEGNSKLYAGLKGAYSDFSSIDWKMDVSGSWEVEDTAGYGLYAGYKLFASWAIEFEYLNFETETKDVVFNVYNPATNMGDVSKADYQSNSYSIYGVYRTPGKVYFKGRLGYSYQESEFSKSSYNLPTTYESGMSGSLGVGTKFKKLAIEVEYTYSTEYLSHLSVGALISF